MIVSFLIGFLAFVLSYHILVTVVGFGLFDGTFPQIPSLFRDGIRVLLFLLSIVFSRKQLSGYRKHWKSVWISFIALCLFSLLISWLKDKSVYDMFVGFKYGFQYIAIFLMATVLGRIAHKQHLSDRIRSFFAKIPLWLVVAVGFGFVRQGLKLIFPNLFLHLGYGPLDDFHFGDKPPLYYLTGLGGTLRRQGIFSGPNNYGYFLIAFLPLILNIFPLPIKARKSRFTKANILHFSINFIWIAAIIATLSRAALVGMIIVLVISNFDRIKNHKKYAGIAGIIVLLGLVGLSVLKGSSTMAHIHAKFGSLGYVFQHPWGYGLGSSGPAIHHNGTILPENYFIQLIIDIGWIGFGVWITTLMYTTKKYIKTISTLSIHGEKYIPLFRSFGIGFVALLVMGLVLHVFEDSMVNYTFFVIWGLYRGYIQGIKTSK